LRRLAVGAAMVPALQRRRARPEPRL